MKKCQQDFVEEFLQAEERRRMADCSLKPVLLWEAFRVIKSSVLCAKTKQHLTQEEYMGVPVSYGLSAEQRHIVHGLFFRNDHWITSYSLWDEADRLLYIFRWGPGVFADEYFFSWQERAFKCGELDLTDDDGMPNAQFFYDSVFADKAQSPKRCDSAI